MTTTDAQDITIVGGGISGLLLAVRLTRALPQASIVVLEKEAEIGGRLAGNAPQLHLVSRVLLDFWAQTLAEIGKEDLQQLADPHVHRQLELVVGTSKVHSLERSDLFSDATVQQLGNRILVSVWQQFCAATQPEKLKKTLKSFDTPLATLLDKLAVMLAQPSLVSLSVAQLQQKIIAWQAQEFLVGKWQPCLQALAKTVQVKTKCQVVTAQHDNDGWLLHSGHGAHRSRVLVVAQPPWSAGEWLASEYLPAALARAVRKSKPHSAVSLVTAGMGEVQLPLELCVPTEGVQVFKTVQGELALTQVLSYETRLRAPAVTAAVGKLKRALRIVSRIYGIEAEARLIALLPAAYCLPLGETCAGEGGIFFCGDSYGKHDRGDDNIVAAVQNISSGIVNFLQK